MPPEPFVERVPRPPVDVGRPAAEPKPDELRPLSMDGFMEMLQGNP